MADLPRDLLWNWRIWWDPVPPEVFRELEESVQRQVLAISLEAQAQMAKTQADALSKIGGVLGRGKQG
jgi:hypothetical protein